MSTILSLGVELVALILWPSTVLLVALLARSPFSPAWIRGYNFAVFTSFLIVTLFAFVVGFAISGFMTVGFGILTATGAVFAVLALSAWIIWIAFGVGERFRQADLGRSPFHGAGPAGGRGVEA